MTNKVRRSDRTIAAANIPKMDPEWKAMWVEALRSGKYKKGMAALKRDRQDGTVEYCCLGVLCEVVGVEWSASRDMYTVNGQSSYLPESILDIVKLSDKVQKELAIVNDNPGGNGWAPFPIKTFPKTFRGIATLIEKYL